MMICPLITERGGELHDCLLEDCGFYTGEKCALACMAQSLDVISHFIQNAEILQNRGVEDELE